jgi:hypothetical protein
MFEYQKMILEKVSFSKQLFIKEFEKSKKWLSNKEFKDLISWINKTFNPNIIQVTEVKPLALKA